jgi:hypothetical protein
MKLDKARNAVEMGFAGEPDLLERSSNPSLESVHRDEHDLFS